MEKYIGFSNEFECDVEIYDDSQNVMGAGRLSFGGGGLIRVQFDSDFCYKTPQVNFSVLRAKAKGGEKFTLFKCEFESYTLYAEFVVIGDAESEISFFHVKYGDVSNWFLRGQHVTGKVGENIVWKNPAPQLLVNVKTIDPEFNT